MYIKVNDISRVQRGNIKTDNRKYQGTSYVLFRIEDTNINVRHIDGKRR